MGRKVHRHTRVECPPRESKFLAPQPCLASDAVETLCESADAVRCPSRAAAVNTCSAQLARKWSELQRLRGMDRPTTMRPGKNQALPCFRMGERESTIHLLHNTGRRILRRGLLSACSHARQMVRFGHEQALLTHGERQDYDLKLSQPSIRGACARRLRFNSEDASAWWRTGVDGGVGLTWT